MWAGRGRRCEEAVPLAARVTQGSFWAAPAMAKVRPMAQNSKNGSSSSAKLFGTDGVRGVANGHPMTAEVAMELGRALAYLIRSGSHRHRVVIGKDTRLSG